MKAELRPTTGGSCDHNEGLIPVRTAILSEGSAILSEIRASISTIFSFAARDCARFAPVNPYTEQHMKKLGEALWKDESGVTAIEYGLIAGLMAALLIGVLGGFSEKLNDLFSAIKDKLGTATDQIKNTKTQ